MNRTEHCFFFFTVASLSNEANFGRLYEGKYVGLETRPNRLGFCYHSLFLKFTDISF